MGRPNRCMCEPLSNHFIMEYASIKRNLEVDRLADPCDPANSLLSGTVMPAKFTKARLAVCSGRSRGGAAERRAETKGNAGQQGTRVTGTGSYGKHLPRGAR